jgi:hypothetical protein
MCCNHLSMTSALIVKVVKSFPVEGATRPSWQTQEGSEPTTSIPIPAETVSSSHHVGCDRRVPLVFVNTLYGNMPEYRFTDIEHADPPTNSWVHEVSSIACSSESHFVVKWVPTPVEVCSPSCWLTFRYVCTEYVRTCRPCKRLRSCTPYGPARYPRSLRWCSVAAATGLSWSNSRWGAWKLGWARSRSGLLQLSMHWRFRSRSSRRWLTFMPWYEICVLPHMYDPAGLLMTTTNLLRLAGLEAPRYQACKPVHRGV